MKQNLPAASRHETVTVSADRASGSQSTGVSNLWNCPGAPAMLHYPPLGGAGHHWSRKKAFIAGFSA